MAIMAVEMLLDEMERNNGTENEKCVFQSGQQKVLLKQFIIICVKLLFIVSIYRRAPFIITIII